jgi:hypothetical protein
VLARGRGLHVRILHRLGKRSRLGLRPSNEAVVRQRYFKILARLVTVDSIQNSSCGFSRSRSLDASIADRRFQCS